MCVLYVKACTFNWYSAHSKRIIMDRLEAGPKAVYQKCKTLSTHIICNLILFATAKNIVKENDCKTLNL